MRVAEIQISPWDKPKYYLIGELMLEKGDRVIVKIDQGNDIGTVVGFVDLDEAVLKTEKKAAEEKKEVVAETTATEDVTVNSELETESEVEETQIEISQIVRKITHRDLDKLPNTEEKRKALEHCIAVKDKLNLPMKIIDVHYAFDGSRITFAFIADGRVDFRELVKDLTRHFSRTIRLQQIGIRDEAKIMGDFGHCGKPLCCKRFLKNFKSITSEMADLQQCSHRGSERISGVCGRLMCCLAYEEEGYENLLQKMPALGTKVNVDGKHGTIVGHHVLKQSVDVEFSGENNEEGTIVEVDINRNKK
ncbi:MAG: regulatory iron-sulfur-containing complex subunit RicT [Candidatus Falkowbacteria bacterium]|nr:regulatory iron-sulfur-containing complex subunit RicT [Candidatus Falkowbacteria bacterium]